MERYLRPERFDADPSSTASSKLWSHWFRTFSNFLTKIQAEDPDKLEILHNYVSSNVYEYVADSATYDNAISTLEKIYLKPSNEVFARHLLATCKQESGQNFDQFLQKLKSLAKDCNFKPVTAEQNQSDAIRDAFISGMTSNNVRQRLLENKSLDLQTAFEQARSLEMAYNQSHSFQAVSEPFSASVSKLNSLQESRLLPQPLTETALTTAAINNKCYFCGYDRHPRSKCPAKEAVCTNCGKKGHFKKVCRSASSSKRITSSIESVLSSVVIASASECLSNAITQITVNEVPLQALIDTGSSDSYISSSVVRRGKWKVEKSSNTISMASTQLISRTQGHCFVTIGFKNDTYNNFKLSVLPDLCADVLLGHDFLNLHKKVEIPFHGDKPPFSLCSLIAAHIEPPSLFNNLLPNCKPIATKSRRHSLTDEQFIRMEVNKLLKDGIIEPSISPWRAQVLVTTNERHKRRMVVDYSQTINRYTLLDAYPLPKIDEMVSKISQFTVFSALDLKSAYHQVPIKKQERQYTAFEACGNLYQFCRIPFGVTNGVACFQRVIDKIIKDEKLDGTFAYIDNITICGFSKDDHDRKLADFLNTAKKYGLTFNNEKSTIATPQLKLLGYEISHGQMKPDPDRLQPLRDIPPPKDMKSQRRTVGLFSYYSQWIPHFSDKIHPLVHNYTFPLPNDVRMSFESFKRELENAVVTTVDHLTPLVVETDASDIAISATLSQNGRPVAFFSRTLNQCEKHHSSVEKEAYAIVEAIRKWRHFLLGYHFQLITDQKSVAFMFDTKHHGKIKNDKIQRWRIELSCYSFDVTYRPGKENHAADALSRSFCSSSVPNATLKELHDSLCHPGVVRMLHFVRSRNLPYSVEDVKSLTSRCSVCAELKPKFCKLSTGTLVKATSPFERLNVDFKGPLPSVTKNRYLLTIIDEYSRFPFAFACKDMTSTTIINCFCQLFAIFGMPSYIHSDRGPSFMSTELKGFLHSKGIATSRTTAYNPQSNGQIERLNQTLWRSITLAAKSRGLSSSQWEAVLLDALHSIRSLLCTATNATPHERLFSYHRKSTSGVSLPTWLTVPGPILMRRSVRSSKYDPLVDEVQLLECNPKYAHVRLPDGREETVSIHHLAPRGQTLPSLHETTIPDNVTHIDPLCDSQTITQLEHHVSDNHVNEPTTTNEASLEPPLPNSPHSSPSTFDQSSINQLLEKQQRLHPYNLRNREV